MGQQTPGCGYDNIGTLGQRSALLLVLYAVGPSIDRLGIHLHVVSKAVDLPVDLLRQLSRRRHNDAVDMILWIIPVG